MIKLKPRLKSLVKYVEKDDKIMDVGCDHALLDVYLVLNNHIKTMCICDVNPNALQNGIANVQRYNLEKEITPVLGYGIERLPEFDIDTLIISGMGSSNIISILSSPNISRIYKLILQSNNNHYDLRKFLVSNGFAIITEEIVEDGKKDYVNIVAIRDYHPKIYTERDYEFGPILTKDKKNIGYFQSLRDSYEDIYFKSGTNDSKEKIRIIDEILEELKKL